MSDLLKYRDAVMEIKKAILQSRYQAARLANKEQLMLYYSIGKYVSENTRSGKWGTGAIEAISEQLQAELPGLRGYSPTNMRYMRLFYEGWTDIFEPNRQLPTGGLGSGKISANRQLSTDELSTCQLLSIHQLSTDEFVDGEVFLRIGFTHHCEILAKCKSVEERWYYIQRCASEFWSVEALKAHIRSKDFEREGTLTNNFELTIPNAALAAKAVRSFKDEYLLDYIDIEIDEDPETSNERVLNREIIANIQKFIMTFGNGFSFIKSQYRLIVEEQEFFVDLLFFSRELNSLVAVELKRGAFKPAYLGQLNFYLSALDEYAKKPHENNAIGLLLCKDAKKTIVELAVRDFNKPMGVAVYKTLNDVPEKYQSLKPLLTGVQEILSKDSEPYEQT